MDNLDNSQVYSGVYDINTITSTRVIVIPIFVTNIYKFNHIYIYTHTFI
jgi:hypothetical protein